MRSDEDLDAEAEVVDGFVDEGPGPVRSHAHAPAPARTPGAEVTRRSMPVVAQAAAVAVTGFAAGAATAAVVRRATRRKGVKAATRRRSDNGLPVLGTRTFLVDVHLLAPRDGR